MQRNVGPRSKRKNNPIAELKVVRQTAFESLSQSRACIDIVPGAGKSCICREACPGMQQAQGRRIHSQSFLLEQRCCEVLVCHRNQPHIEHAMFSLKCHVCSGFTEHGPIMPVCVTSASQKGKFSVRAVYRREIAQLSKLRRSCLFAQM